VPVVTIKLELTLSGATSFAFVSENPHEWHEICVYALEAITSERPELTVAQWAQIVRYYRFDTIIEFIERAGNACPQPV